MSHGFKPADPHLEGETPAAVKARSRIWLAALAVLVVAIVVLGVLLAQSVGRAKELDAALTQAEVVSKAREERQQGVIEELQGKMEELLNVQQADPVITRGQIEEQLGSLRELVTQRYIYTNAAQRRDNLTWLMNWPVPLSESSLLVTYDGEIKAGIDFGEIQVDVDEGARRITVTLPPSKVLDNIIPQESIQIVDQRNGVFNKITLEEYNAFMAAEKPVMEQKAVEMGLLTEADREARTAIRALLELIPGMDTYQLTVK